MKSNVLELVKLIQKHKALYYEGRPEISDEEYDQIEENLREQSPEHPVLNLVGSDPKGLGKIEHETKMLSLGKTYKQDEVFSWSHGQDFISMFKIDGVSGSLIYNDGKLEIAKTRGNGIVGENILTKVLWIEDIPKTISESSKLEVRGEIFCTQDNFLKLSKKMERIGLDRPTSMRNIVAGLISRKDHISLCQYLSFNAFSLEVRDRDFKTETEKLISLKEMKFPTPFFKPIQNEKELALEIKRADEFMSGGSYLIDGLVFSLNSVSLQKEMGSTAHHPRFKLAFKFQGRSQKTILNSIEWQVSRQGILTPVGHVEPVELSGAIISKVTLHNFGVVRAYSLGKGDQIEIIRSGEVIPKFLSVIKSMSKLPDIPKNCPVCKSKIEEVDIRIFCTNESCPGRLREGILHFIKKIEIDDLSSKRLEEMMDKKLVNSIDDIYKLKADDLLQLNKVKEKLANKLIHSIENSKKTTLLKFLSALGISGGAINKCEKILKSGYLTLESVQGMEIDELCQIEGFAEKSAKDFIESLRSKKGLIQRLLEEGLIIEDYKVVVQGPLKFNGLKFCITGKLSRKRSDIQRYIKDHGGSVMSQVSKNTDILVTNEEDSSSSKFKKAVELNIRIQSEDEVFGQE